MKHTPQIECASHLSEMLTHGSADLAITRAIKLIKDLMRGIDGAPRDQHGHECNTGHLAHCPLMRTWAPLL